MTLTIHMIACKFSTCTVPLSCSQYARYQLSVMLAGERAMRAVGTCTVKTTARDDQSIPTVLTLHS